MGEFSNLIKTQRMKQFSNPKQFTDQADLSCGYLHYLHVEKGERIPTADIAIELLEILCVDVRAGMMAWLRDQISGEQYKRMFGRTFKEIRGRPLKKNIVPRSQIQNSSVVTRAHVPMFLKDPIYWDLISYLNAYSSKGPFNIKNLASELGVTEDRISTVADELYDAGLVEKTSDDDLIGPDWLIVPLRESMDRMREKNFRLMYRRYKEAKRDRRFQLSITKPLTPEQIQEALDQIMMVVDDIVEFEENPDAPAYSISLFTCERSFKQ